MGLEPLDGLGLLFCRSQGGVFGKHFGQGLKGILKKECLEILDLCADRPASGETCRALGGRAYK
jgi:hypothetical protein